jgi:tetratricopeptide (TPR) repeat protein
MQIRYPLIVGILLVCFSFSGYGLDWVALNQQADSLSLEEASNAVKSAPKDLEALYILGLVYLNEHKDGQAKEAFAKMQALEPESIEARWGLAEVLRRRKKIEESEKILTKLIKVSPRFYPAYISLAYLRYRQGDFNQAVSLAKKVRAQADGNVDLSNITRSYLIIGGAKGMIASSGGPLSKLINGTQVFPNLKKAEALQPDSPAVLFGLGSFYFLAPKVVGGDLGKAVEYLQRAIEVDPLFADAYVRLAQVYNLKQDRGKYQEYLTRAAEIDPENDLLLDETSGVCLFNCVSVEE